MSIFNFLDVASSAKFLRLECDRFGFREPIRVIVSIDSLVYSMRLMSYEAFYNMYLSTMADSLEGRAVLFSILGDCKVSYSLYSNNDYHLITIESAKQLILVLQ